VLGVAEGRGTTLEDTGTPLIIKGDKMNIKISQGYEVCHGCGGRQSKKKITAEYSRKEIELCEKCCEKMTHSQINHIEMWGI